MLMSEQIIGQRNILFMIDQLFMNEMLIIYLLCRKSINNQRGTLKEGTCSSSSRTKSQKYSS